MKNDEGIRGRHLLAAVALVFAVAVAATLAVRSAPGDGSPVEASYRKARAVLDAGVKALGPAPEDIAFRVTGNLLNRQQSPSATDAVASPVYGVYQIDVAGGRVAWDLETSFPGGFQARQGIRIGKDQSAFLNNQLRTTQPLGVPAAQQIEVFLNRIPQSLLARAAQRANTLRWVGEADFRGRKHSVVSFTTANGSLIALWFDSQTSTLSKYETLGTDPYLGDAITEFAYKGWRTVGSTKFPTGQLISIGGEPTQDYDYADVRINSKLAESVFALPANYTAVTPPTVAFDMKKLADDVYLVEGIGPQGGYSSLAVAFKDYILVVEAPLGDAAAKQLLAKVRETIPGKPVRYVATTHHHSDHSGGIRTFIAEGATVVTTPGNVAYFEKTAQQHFTMPPDALETSPKKPRFELVTGRKRVFTDGNHTLELIDIGPNPHANELLVAWLPKERIIFEGDMFFKNPDNSTAPATAATIHFADAIGKLGLQPATYVGVHQRVYTQQELRAAIDLARQQGTVAAEQGKH